MPLKTNNLKFITNVKHFIALSLTLFVATDVAQEIIEDRRRKS